MVAAVSRVSSLLVGTLLLLMSVGTTASLVPLVLAERGTEPWLIGIVAAVYNLGLAAGGLDIGRWVARIGHLRTFAGLAIVASSSLLLLPLVDALWVWALARFGFGFAVGGLYVVIESWMASVSEPSNRGQVLSVYMMVVYAGIALGQMVLAWPDQEGFARFAIVAGLLSLAALPVLVSTAPAPDVPGPSRVGVLAVARQSPLGLAAAAVAGFTTGAVYAVAPVYAAHSGLGTAQVGPLMTAFVLGGVLLQVPFGRAADRGDGARVLALACAVAVVGCTLGLLLEASSVVVYGVAATIGAGVFSLYGLAIGLCLTRVDPDDVLSTNAALFLIFCGGSSLGALACATSLQAWGPGGFFGSLLLPTALLGAYAVAARIRMHRA